MGHIYEDKRRENEIERAPFCSRNDKDTLRVSGKPEMVLDYKRLQRTSPNKCECTGSAGPQ